MNSKTQIKVRRYKMEYAADTIRLGEYTAETIYSAPRKKAIIRIDRICFGMRIERALDKRQIARKEIIESRPTCR
jgi:hypothetical protein